MPSLRAMPLVSAAAVVAAGIAYAAGTPARDARSVAPQEAVKTAAELAFPDAPLGVDPVVTGPRTAAFKAQQEQAGCAGALWPNIPAACYPGR